MGFLCNSRRSEVTSDKNHKNQSGGETLSTCVLERRLVMVVVWDWMVAARNISKSFVEQMFEEGPLPLLPFCPSRSIRIGSPWPFPVLGWRMEWGALQSNALAVIRSRSKTGWKNVDNHERNMSTLF